MTTHVTRIIIVFYVCKVNGRTYNETSHKFRLNRYLSCDLISRIEFKRNLYKLEPNCTKPFVIKRKFLKAKCTKSSTLEINLAIAEAERTRADQSLHAGTGCISSKREFCFYAIISRFHNKRPTFTLSCFKITLFSIVDIF